MKKRRFAHEKIIVLSFFFLLASAFLFFGNMYFPYTGMVTDTGTVSVTSAGAAGISITDPDIAFGSGYYNATCTTGYAVLDSNLTYSDGSVGTVYAAAHPYCWINTSAILNGEIRDPHTIENNGSSIVNVSAIANLHAEDFLCGGNCPFTNFALVEYFSVNNEINSCTGATSGYEAGMTFNTNVTIGICDRLDSQDSMDAVNV